jgi:hypothetical protein
MTARPTIDAASVPGPVAGHPDDRIVCTRDRPLRLFWAWPMLNTYNRLLTAEKDPAPGLAAAALSGLENGDTEIPVDEDSRR